MAQNEMEIEILADGTVKITTDRFSGPVHVTAERFLAYLEGELGGQTTVRRRAAHVHVHEHAHEHDHHHDHDHEKSRA